MGKVVYRDLSGYGRTARRRFEEFWRLWPTAPLVDEVHPVVFVDGIYLARNVVMLIACTKTHVIGWHMARSEHAGAWSALFSRIAASCVVVCDGGSGIMKALRQEWPTTRVQRCVFHAFNAVKRKTTTRPRTNAGVELYAIAKALLKVKTPQEAHAWRSELTAWNASWAEFLTQKTKLADGRIVNTHRHLVDAKNSLNALMKSGLLFTFLDPDLIARAGVVIPATSNQIEGGSNTLLRTMLRTHRGMCLQRRIKAVAWWCYLHTPDPLPPAQLLAHTVTDEQIVAMYQLAHDRRAAQEELNMWGTGAE
ncbi:hypothetical protein J2S49_001002 [Arcanobacterium wilhelmae]|uniref:Mutator family transposase n=1 Tax=Arcanobacterium wilhelmae TaxID=1803177 RepID=A0ABT9NC13_9ACTO|nr:hypothetical protein [Arcanobacterium wilhelmae]